jgi:alcohol dehydrogenase class IV
MGAQTERIFTFPATNLKFGPGALDEIGSDIAALAVQRALLVTDPNLIEAGHAERAMAAIQRAGVEVVMFDGTRIEPDTGSLRKAAEAARDAGVDGYVSLGGGSCIDTAKVANLLARNPGKIEDYINPPLGDGRQPEVKLNPHVAVPTTAGTGAESTTVAAVEMPEHRVKSGISSHSLRPTMAILDTQLTATLPPAVAAASGLDVICHAAESFTSLPFYRRAPAESPAARPPYQGANPLSDVWAERALELGGHYLRRAVHSPDDYEAREAMLLAATAAGVGFATAGVHIPHACSYPVAGLRHDRLPRGYNASHPFIPHGQAVAVTAPATFRFTYQACPERHDRAAQLLTGREGATGPNALADALAELIADVGMPRNLAELGYSHTDLDILAEAAMEQHRLISGSPRSTSLDDVREILGASLYEA